MPYVFVRPCWMSAQTWNVPVTPWLPPPFTGPHDNTHTHSHARYWVIHSHYWTLLPASLSQPGCYSLEESHDWKAEQGRGDKEGGVEGQDRGDREKEVKAAIWSTGARGTKDWNALTSHNGPTDEARRHDPNDLREQPLEHDTSAYTIHRLSHRDAAVYVKPRNLFPQ